MYLRKLWIPPSVPKSVTALPHPKPATCGAGNGGFFPAATASRYDVVVAGLPDQVQGGGRLFKFVGLERLPRSVQLCYRTASASSITADPASFTSLKPAFFAL